ncbi:hypothetical protein MKK69_11230 [Methylobacterium sp. J-026]|uniref:hypothetical protein n=1 Tax=Methylobacterium sp. J-026 TaxID=2836624 RepID=UPI001FB9E017|nr:hypothetical protein [Methylobacterium sp. J-026]MCJ2134622.1 hypothetical protein [Methylobacterium sp. J-026]
MLKLVLQDWPPLFARGVAGLIAASGLGLLAYRRGERLTVPRALFGRLGLAAAIIPQVQDEAREVCVPESVAVDGGELPGLVEHRRYHDPVDLGTLIDRALDGVAAPRRRHLEDLIVASGACLPP